MTLKTWGGIAAADIKTYQGIAKASVKTVNGEALPAAGDPYWANVTLLAMNDNGANGTTSFTDQSAGAHTITTAGGAVWSSAAAPTGLSTSGLFDGTGDALTLDGSTDYAFGTGDYTIEAYIRATTLGDATGNCFYDGRGAGQTGFYPHIATLGSAGSEKLVYFVNGSIVITGGTTLSTGVWYHAAVARSGTNTKLFLNGTQEGSTWSDGSSFVNGTSRPMLGGNGNNGGVPFWKGYLAAMRVTKGVARYTGTFTPPSLPLPTS